MRLWVLTAAFLLSANSALAGCCNYGCCDCSCVAVPQRISDLVERFSEIRQGYGGVTGPMSVSFELPGVSREQLVETAKNISFKDPAIACRPYCGESVCGIECRVD
ncbi:hypothetical protein PGB28_00210 [Primorskyibacter aestuariivivens]|uniref:hypothetical protein n=1 Tax=Primorskyibacter aestuariivivens TaxID=1888912 RepID=UPI0023013641|nr:hypothetical protein [Primorskyibacter aestuariivivens]MDA7426861.1 hypothetical protein [Primorskyibacter aestuariivivens]